MSDIYPVIKLIESVADGNAGSVSADLANNIKIKVTADNVSFTGNLKDILALLDKTEPARMPILQDIHVRNSGKENPRKEYTLSSAENPHPTCMLVNIRGTTYRLDVDYIVSQKDIITYALISKTQLLKIMAVTSANLLDAFLRKIPRFVLKPRSQVFYHPMHLYWVFSNALATKEPGVTLTEGKVAMIHEMTRLSPCSIPEPGYMYWFHSTKNPWLVNFRAICGSIDLYLCRSACLYDRLAYDVSKEYRGLIDVRLVLRRFMELKDRNPKHALKHACQKDYLRRCILEINDYAKRHDIKPGHDYDDLDLTIETLNGEPA